MADVTSLINYYVNLLIIQYTNQPNATAEINLLADTLLAEGVYFDVQNAYNLLGTNTAIGAQLDILGKYAGVDRYYAELILTQYSALVEYSEAGSLPTPPARNGLETYATFNEYDYNGTLAYADIITSNNFLNDANFLTLIQLAIVNNNSNFSNQSIDQSLFNFFGTSIRAEDVGNMHMVFYISANLTPLIQAITAKGLLPKPMGVGATIVSGVSPLIFAMTDYAGDVSPFGAGFSTYSNYATLSGQTLTYNQLTTG